MYVNEYQMAQSIYVLYGDSRTWLDAITKAQVSESTTSRWPNVQRATSLPESPALNPNRNHIGNLNPNNPKPNPTVPTNLKPIRSYCQKFLSPDYAIVACCCSGTPSPISLTRRLLNFSSLTATVRRLPSHFSFCNSVAYNEGGPCLMVSLI